MREKGAELSRGTVAHHCDRVSGIQVYYVVNYTEVQGTWNVFLPLREW